LSRRLPNSQLPILSPPTTIKRRFLLVAAVYVLSDFFAFRLRGSRYLFLSGISTMYVPQPNFLPVRMEVPVSSVHNCDSPATPSGARKRVFALALTPLGIQTFLPTLPLLY